MMANLLTAVAATLRNQVICAYVHGHSGLKSSQLVTAHFDLGIWDRPSTGLFLACANSDTLQRRLRVSMGIVAVTLNFWYTYKTMSLAR